ncbi:glucose-1-phosphate thymidylyltransferase [Streptomyces misionensis]|uniref:Glucose-1-phosphate thymidylyltransferase n=1 Tax=Streptomyces misionensis TaxID=67331 RepID=A0A1H4IAU8_9ACTN|nr:glucose-1-phosphate thymidylyltransferase [Streptomyces misionensis]SEB31093.1 glucose-1-phosphate thymidylyltransferase [Streptomyces misionensis]
MKALVLSGGRGTRLRPFSYSMPKQLIPVANQPVLEHVLDNLRAIGVEEVGVIVGDWAPQIRSLLGDGGRYGMRITYIPQDEPRGLADCVAIARDFLGDDDFVMYLGDNMLLQGVREIAEAFRARRPAAQVLVHKVADPRAFGVAEVDAEGRVLAVEEKPQEPRSDLALIGVYFFTPAVHQAVAGIRPSARGELEITDAIAWLVEHGARVEATEYGGYWRDTGCVEDVLDCNRELLDSLTGRTDGMVDAASELVGEVVVEAGARVIRSRIEGPVVVGAGTVIEDSHVDPHTAIGRDCRISDATLGYSIALDGATVRQVRGIHGSLIGRAAVVSAAGEELGRHRVVVGDHTTVEVAA